MSDLPSLYAIFNGWNLNNTPGLQVYAIDVPGQQKKTLNIAALARRNARKVSSGFLQSNQLNLGVYVKAASRAALEQALDTLYANIQSRESALVIPKSGTTRQYTVSYESTAINNPVQGALSPSGNVADLTLIFQCSDSYGYDTEPTLVSSISAQTLSSLSTTYTQGGGAEWQVPVFQLQLNSLTASGTNIITVGNLDNGQQITITREWSIYDFIVIDCRKQSVTVNGVEVEFTGAFPKFNPGTQTWTYGDSFTARSVKIYADVVNRWN